jgi:hypothetical protein
MKINPKIWRTLVAPLLATSVFFAMNLQLAHSAEGRIAPPKLPRIDGLADKHVSLPLTKIALGKLDVIFERTTLSEILRSAGVGKIEHRGDAGDSQYWVCYTVTAGKKSQRIWFMSGEMGGDQHTMDSFHVEDNASPAKSNICPELPADMTPITIGKSIWLGSNQRQIKEWLGEPSLTKNGWLFYSYSGKASLPGFDEAMVIGVHTINGKVVSLFTSKTTTN